MQKYADIVLPVPLPKLFTYEIPSSHAGVIVPGSRVVVPFGKKKLLSGIVVTIHHDKPLYYETKPIQSALDQKPVVNEFQLRLWQWIAGYYQCTLGEVYKAALPSGLKLESESLLFYNDENDLEHDFKGKTREIIEFISKRKKCTINELNNITGLKNCYGHVIQLVDAGVVLMQEHLNDNNLPTPSQLMIALNSWCRDEENLKLQFEKLERAPRQLEVFLAFVQEAGGLNSAMRGMEVERKRLLSVTSSATQQLNELLKKGILVQEKKVVDINPLPLLMPTERKTLSVAQNNALQEVVSGFATSKPVLLHGVTSSGKTELYIRLIDKTIEQGKQALYLLPEIALTTQITNRLKACFGDSLGVYHSKFSDRERVNVWNSLLNQTGCSVVLGARSAVFLPFNNLGLIIVDEEHEHSFKQIDPAPRYHARDVAIVLGRMHGADVLLGTATPSIESYYNADTGKYIKVELMTRHENIQLPEIVVADTRDASRRKMMQNHFSPQLIEHLGKALSRNEQVILFQNRRGFSPYLECGACAWVHKCNHCDVSLTYHKNINSSICHYCGFATATTMKCQACGSIAMVHKGFGTQKIEEEIKEIFPTARVGRMDFDTTRSRKGYENTINEFERGGFDILVGTQMISKGLDFDRVSVVGILDAENLLNNPDFRAFERGFQMMSQVGGRAGRKNRRGTVVLQTSNPEHPVITQVKNNDFLSFYNQQITERHAFKYPPFFRIVNLTIKNKDKNVARQSAQFLTQNLREAFGDYILGPHVPIINKIKDLHLQRVTVKIGRDAPLAKAKELINDGIQNVHSIEKWRNTIIVIDVDPL